MAIAGKVAITPKGEWNANTAYTKLDLVFYENASYVAIQPSTAVEPTNTSYWMLVVQSAGGADLEAIIDGTTQVGNALTLDGHGAEYFAKETDLSNYLLKSGGTVEGNVTLYKNEASSILLYLVNLLRTVYQEVLADGTYTLYDKTNSKSIIISTADGTNTFNGTASGNIKYTDKPTGTYTGNGSATERVIQTGGIGYLLIVYSNSGVAFVTPSGAIKINDGAFSWLSHNKVTYLNGKLTISTEESVVNSNGDTFYYYCV